MTLGELSPQDVGGPYFDELERGQVFESSPTVTLTAGHAALHQAIVGDRMRLPLDDALALEVAGTAPLAHPALVWDMAIGQSTTATHRVVANLFYRGLQFHSTPRIGDTLRTRTEVVALRQNSPKEGRRATGLVALRVTTVDQRHQLVLDFWRCAMLPLRDEATRTGHADDLASVGAAGSSYATTAFDSWDLDALAAHDAGRRAAHELQPGQCWTVDGGDVVSSAPELARLTLNVAKVHHDAGHDGRRLVYGGHSIGVALAQTCRVLPNIVAVVAWHSCDHVGPVYEADTLHSRVEVEAVTPRSAGGALVQLRSLVTAASAERPSTPVLDWRFVVLHP